MRLPRPILIPILLLLAGASACATHNPKEDLQPTEEQMATLNDRANLFYKYMRWEMFDEASQLVTPKKRLDFLNEFTPLADQIDITNVVVVDLTPIDKDHVDMITRFSWYHKPEQIVRKSLYTEHWKWDNNQWYLESRDLESPQ